ncbi:MAG TPA: diiron oxygenase [candidate division Zixibacteria bacterium]|nr:diiron oxygenase [candidate division Zixibacteria bacterium]
MIRSRDVVDRSSCFVPEFLTPLFYTSIYRDLNEEQRLCYNQLHGCYCNEQIMFLERCLAEPALRSLSDRLPGPLRGSLRTFLAEEKRHSRLFRRLNRRCFPELYRRRDFHFLALSPGWHRVVRAAARRPFFFSLVIWLMLLEEERAVAIGLEYLRGKDRLEPNFVALHRLHVGDEIGHVHWDQQILDVLWPQIPAWSRRLNAILLRWIVDEFLITPKRSNWRVVRELAVRFPELRFRLPEIRRALAAVGADPAWRDALHSGATIPRTLDRLRAVPEMDPVREALLAR